jgi:predicted alpha/beta-hydrolase family hydrolase
VKKIEETFLSSLTARKLKFQISEKAGEVSALLLRPEGARALLVFAHGAGAGMQHKFMEEVSQKLASRAIATLRYQFPYMEKGSKRPDSEGMLTETARAAVAAAKKHAGELPLFAGGKSMGGRMTSLAAARAPLDSVRGLVFFGFPRSMRPEDHPPSAGST